tara:strand:+ start:6000 stop:7058 length:1059 start_codon:yes stop_codon:yes gene_type:complete
MASLTHEQIDDFVELTLNRYKRDQWVDISLPLQKYHFASRWFKSKKKPEKGGPRLEWKLRVSNQGTAKHSGLYAIDDTNRVNVMTKGRQEWSKQTVNYIYDIDEDAFQSGPETIIREMLLNEQGLYNDFFELMETAMWTAPQSDSQDPRPPAGIPFWLQKNATLGFNGGDPSGFGSGAAGISTGTYDRWKNYSGTYTQVSRNDLIEKIVNACDFTRFEAPHPYPEIGGGQPDYGLYSVHSVLATCRRLLQTGNDNLGPDVARWAGQVLIKGIVLEWVPALTESTSDAYDSQDPLYGINWNKFEYFFKEGRNMIKHAPKEAARQHTVRERHMDNWGNFVCYDRRCGGFVFHNA